MEEGQIKKILKNLDNKEHTCLVEEDKMNDFMLNKVQSLESEVDTYKEIVHLLSELYYNDNKYLCELGLDESTPHLINDDKGENILIIPAGSTESALFCVSLCNLLNDLYLCNAPVLDTDSFTKMCNILQNKR